MADIAIILDNIGNDVYAQNAREYLTSPIYVNLMRVLLSDLSQLNNTIKVRNQLSVGTESNRDISLQKYISAMDKTNLIVDVPLDPPLLLDGKTSFEIVLAANSEIILLFYLRQEDIGDQLK